MGCLYKCCETLIKWYEASWWTLASSLKLFEQQWGEEMETSCVQTLCLEYATRLHVIVASGYNSSERSFPGTSARIFMTYVSACSKLPYKCLLD